MNLTESAPGLLHLLKQQYEEGEADLCRRIDKMERSYRAWRGLYQDQDEQSERNGYKTVANSIFAESDAIELEDAQTDTVPNLYERETFRQVETILAVLDEAYLAPPKPFELVLPKIFYGQPDFGQMMKRKQDLRFISAWVQDAYGQGGKGADRTAFRHCLCLGTGITYSRPSALWKSYPRGENRCIPRWRFRVDPEPDGGEIENARFGMVEYRYTAGEAINKWPEERDDILEAASTAGSVSLMEDANEEDLLRRTITVQEVFGHYDLEAIEQAYDDQEDAQDAGTPKLYSFVMLCQGTGLSETMLGKPAELPASLPGIPFTAYTLMKSLTEKGIDGLSVPELMEEDQVLINTLRNNLDIAAGLASQQGGFYDALIDKGIETPLSGGFSPGDWKPVNVGPMGDLSSKFFGISRLYDPGALGVIQTMLQQARQGVQRTLGVTDQMAGLSAQTNSDTAEEANLLMAQSNRRLRLYASNLDDAYRRNIKLFCLASSLALKREEDKALGSGDTPQTVFYYDEEKQVPGIIQSDAFDEMWEIDLRAGSNWISDKAKMRDLSALFSMITPMNMMPEAQAIVRRLTMMMGEDPEITAKLNRPTAGVAPPLPPGGNPNDPPVVPIEQSPEAQMAQMAMMMQAQQGQKQGGPG